MTKDGPHYRLLAERLLSQRTSSRRLLKENLSRLEELEIENRYLRNLLNMKRSVPSRLASVSLAARRRGFGRKYDLMDDIP